MEYIVLTIALLIMAPAALLPFIVSAHDNMEADLARKQPVVAPTRVHQVMPQPVASSMEQRTAA